MNKVLMLTTIALALAGYSLARQPGTAPPASPQSIESPILSPGPAARLNRWEFLLVVAPLPVTGGTGFPVNALAIF